MNLYWQSFLRHAASQSTVGSIREFGGLEAAWANSTLVINNGTYLASAPSSEAELRNRIASACDDARPHGLPRALYLYEPYLTGVASGAIASEFGLHRVMGLQVMTGDVRKLKPPLRPLPDVEFSRVTTREDTWTVFDINLRSYGMPVSMADSVLDTNAYYSNPQREIGFVALADGVPVSTTSVIELDGWLYVAMVATDPGHRRKGYAEAVMRHALEVSAATMGTTRTALDASVMGAPLYSQMGYQDTGASWTMYAA